ncbi:sensor histidine kinase [Nocardioides sp.]|uniref:sensor histidine kinase n=1 Tax=Nocardioides sp. TaxID=35761 RepID=UPI002D7F86DE|nr:ATP-binding protein [Nocardioides sp.]HET8959931.1 ATP-binding protein [Nocardioides sp.]
MAWGDAGDTVAATSPGEGRAARVSTPALTAIAAVVGLVATMAILTTPFLLFGYRNPSLHLALDSVDACIAVLLAYLLFGRFSRSRRLQDALLAEGLAMLAMASVATGLAGAALDVQPYTLEAWAPLSLRLIGALLIGAAGLVGDREVTELRRSPAVLGPLVLAGVVMGVLVAFHASLPVAVAETMPASAAHPVVTGHPLLVAAQAVGAASFVVAAAGFSMQSSGHDVLLRWVGPACVLGAFSRLHYVLFPSIYSGWIYTGDLLRTACYLLLLVGAALEIGSYWRSQARLAVLDDRRRLARELHDGVVQELSYIRSEAHLITDEDGVRARIVDSVDRATDEARAAIDTLGSEGDAPLGLLLHGAARQVAERYGRQVVVDLDVSIDATPEQGHDLVRITREAVSNAIRHGRARNIGIGLLRDRGGLRLVVHDDGRGFDPGDSQSTGYGMTSMRERAENLPGTLRVSSTPGRGATVVVEW